MSGLFKRPSVLDRDMDRIQRKVSPLERGTPYLDQLYKPERPRAVAVPGEEARGDGCARRKGSGVSGLLGLFHWGDFWPDVFGGGDSRLKQYLSGSFETARPVRYQRRIRRNQLVVLAVFFVFVMIWAVGRWG
ncbi:MAG: hypothetical protein ISS35_06585 [Kiritimatiellae bacterium]|nr:hypothetical protein [Kiritimatiellia bacterium]